MAADWTLRPADAGDAPAMIELAAEAFALYVPRIGRRPAPMDADYAALIAGGHARVAVDAAGRVQGFVVAYPSDDGAAWLIETVAVAPALQGRGLGGRLLAAAEAAGRAAGAGVARLYTNAAMTENLAFYPKRGWREVDRRTEEGFERVYFDKPLKEERDATGL